LKCRKGNIEGTVVVISVEKEKPEQAIKCQKWRIHPTTEQKEKLKLWLEATRWIYNKAVAMVNTNIHKAVLKDLRELIIHDKVWKNPNLTPVRMRDVPYTIRDSPLQDLLKAIKILQAKGTLNKFKFRCKKDLTASVTIGARELNCKTTGGLIWPDFFGTVRDRSAMQTEKGKMLPLEFRHDTRLVYERCTGFFYLCVPLSVSTSDMQSETQGLTIEMREDKGKHKRGKLVSIDPGVRTFATCYDPSGHVTEWGTADTCDKLRYLAERATCLDAKAISVKGRHRKRIAAVAARLRKRAVNMVDELHRKTARWLCNNYEAILLPQFNTREMVQRKNRVDGKKRKINKKTAGSMVKLSHYKFRLFLQHKAAELGSTVVLCDERYTSKTCGNCGMLNNKLGGNKIFTCSCSYSADRDHNAARNILLKYACTDCLLNNRVLQKDAGGALP